MKLIKPLSIEQVTHSQKDSGEFAAQTVVARYHRWGGPDSDVVDHIRRMQDTDPPSTFTQSKIRTAS